MRYNWYSIVLVLNVQCIIIWYLYVFQNDHNSNTKLFFLFVNHLIFLLCFIIVDILRHLNLCQIKFLVFWLIECGKKLHSILDIIYICCYISNILHACVLSSISHVQPFATRWPITRQVPLSMWLSRQEYWSELPCPSPGDLPNPGMKPASLMSPALAGGFFTTSTTWEDQLHILLITNLYMDFPVDSEVKNPPANAGDTGDTSSIPGSGRSPWEGNGKPFQYSCLDNTLDRGAGELQSMRLQRVRHDGALVQTLHTLLIISFKTIYSILSQQSQSFTHH